MDAHRISQFSSRFGSCNEKNLTAKLEAEIKEKDQKLGEKDLKIDELSKKLDEFERIKETRKIVDVTCAECGFVDNETRLNICRSCTKIHSKIDVLNIKNPSEIFDIKEFAICSTCLIRKHMCYGHAVVEFYPVLTEINHKIQVTRTDGLNSQLNTLSKKMESVSNRWVNLAQKCENDLSVMTNMIKMAKSTTEQKELEKNIIQEFEKIFNAAEKAVETLNNQADEFEDSLKTENDEKLL